VVDIQSFTINPQDMATSYKGTAILEILKVELNNLNLSRLKIMALLIENIIQARTICLWKLCEHIETGAKTLSVNRRLQRFVAEVVIQSELLAKFIIRACGVKDDIYLLLDRTNWKFGETNINILVLAISYEGKGIPLFWKFLDKRGNSNELERVELLQKFKDTFPDIKIAGLLADREFIGEQWFLKLNKMNIPFFIRIRNNFIIKRKSRLGKVSCLFRRLNINGLKIYHKKRNILNVPLFISGTKIRNKFNKVDYCIVVSNYDHENPLYIYKKRWQIECMFKNLKSAGFNFEDTHIKKYDRLSNILSLLTIAYIWITKVADKIVKENSFEKLLAHGRKLISHFRVGLRSLVSALTSTNSKTYTEYAKLLSYT
jgi:hypothetical protein